MYTKGKVYNSIGFSNFGCLGSIIFFPFYILAIVTGIPIRRLLKK